MNITITPDYEVCEVLRTFPILKTTLAKDLHLDLNNIDSNDTIASYLRKQSFSNEEIRIVLRKMNHKLKSFFKTPVMYPVSYQDETKNAIILDKETIDEEE